MHILGSLTGRIYINLLKEGRILLTNSSAIDEARVDQCRKWWGKITRLVVECTRDQLRVLDYGFTPSKVSLVYPAVDLNRFSYHPPPDRFTIGFASSPISNDRLGIQKRGVDLLLSVAREFSDIHFVLLWRGKHLHQLRTLTQNIPESNVTIINKILPDMDKFYATVNCTILPATFMDDCKPCPNSIMESLSAGKPALVSDQVGIADLVSNSGSGLVFKPDRDHLIPTIYEMRNNYWKHQASARVTAERYFSVPTFLEAYTDIYNELTQL
jgi:glycosyltransferase involved in cell wall biosynthesis